MSAIIELSNIGKSFYTDEIETQAVSGINLSIEKGEYLSLRGPSGCGKSTLLSMLGLLDVPTQGQYILDHQDVSSLSPNERAAIRCQQIGFVFQSFNLISELSVVENVMLPLTYQKSLTDTFVKEKVDWVLDKVQMSHRKAHYPSQLSGGQQQRIAVARSLVNDPTFILADEPTGNLDSQNAQAVMDLFSQLHQDGATICMVTHDPRSAEQAQRQVSMVDGKVVSDSKGSNAVLENGDNTTSLKQAG